MKIISTLLAICFAFALSACTTTAAVDKWLVANAPKACNAAAVSHLAFVRLSASGKIKQRDIDREALLYNKVEVLCANPANFNSVTVILVAIDTYSEFVRNKK